MNYKHIFETVLRESKKDLITNNKYLTDEQKEEMLTFFYGDGDTKKPHTNLDSKIDWNKPKDIYEEFVSKIKNVYETESSISLSIQTNGYNEGEDYLDYGEKNGLHYYIPLNYKVQKEVFQKDCPDRWCIGWKKNAKHWHRYTDKGSIFIIVYSKKDNICVQYNKAKDEIAIWNKQDKSYGFDKTEFLECIETHSLSLKNAQRNWTANNPNDNEALALSDEKEFINKFNVDILEKWINNFDEIHEEIVRQDDYEVRYTGIEATFQSFKDIVRERMDDDGMLRGTNIFVGFVMDIEDRPEEFNFAYVSNSNNLESQKHALLRAINSDNYAIRKLHLHKITVESLIDNVKYFELFVTVSIDREMSRITFTPHLYISSNNGSYNQSGDIICIIREVEDEAQLRIKCNEILDLVTDSLNID